MNAGFLHLQALCVILVAIAVLLAGVFIQRLYFRLRTQQVDAVETMALRFSDWLTLFTALLVAWFAFAAFSAWQSHADWLSAEKGSVVRTIEVGMVDESGTTLLVYQGDQTLTKAREEIVVSSQATFTIDLEVLRFSGLLKAFGQGDVLRVVTINGSEPVGGEGEGTWPWISSLDRIRIHAPKEIQKGELYEVRVNQQNLLEIHRKE